MTAKLRLGPIPKAQQIKITITVNAELKETLERYAAAHSSATGDQNDVARLIPYMLEAFMSSDRAFRRGKFKISPQVVEAAGQ